LILKQKQINKYRGYRYEFKTTRKQVCKVLDAITEATQPLLYVGGGAISSNSEKELKEFVEFFKIPITTTLMGKSIFDENHPLALGMLGMHGTVYANY
jgi:acetolactate synthase-1/2/3 large subunit